MTKTNIKSRAPRNLVAAAAISFLAAACGSNQPEPALAPSTLAPTTTSVQTEQSTQESETTTAEQTDTPTTTVAPEPTTPQDDTVTTTTTTPQDDTVTTTTTTDVQTATLSGTVSHGWADPLTDELGSGPSCRLQLGGAHTDSMEGLSGADDSLGVRGLRTAESAVTSPNGDVIGAVVEVVDGPDAGRQSTTDDRGCYVLEGLEQARFAIRSRAEGFAPVGGVVDLTSDRSLAGWRGFGDGRWPLTWGFVL